MSRTGASSVVPLALAGTTRVESAGPHILDH